MSMIPLFYRCLCILLVLFSNTYSLVITPSEPLSRNPQSGRLSLTQFNITQFTLMRSFTNNLTNLGVGIKIDCSRNIGENLDLEHVLSAWRKIPRDEYPITFANEGTEADVEVPKCFSSCMASLPWNSNNRRDSDLIHF